MNQSLINYILHLGDNTLILSQRNSEWCGHGPVLEQDIAITNISLDLIGQARSFYQYAATLINQADSNSPSTGGGRGEASEDSLAYLRDERSFKNCLLTELTNGDWGQTILRQFFFSVFQYLLYQQLQQSKDATLAAIAEKSLKEVTYHLRWSSEWVIRLGDGTEESHERMVKALGEWWGYTGEFFIPVDYETAAAAEGTGVDVAALQQSWLNKVQEVLQEATLPLPSPLGEGTYMHTGGKSGRHTEHLGYILAEMQYMQRAYPGAEW
ncbi:phenylacetate-CoA oxygenase subunit PaaC [Pseudoflavitalea sp. X16]|uniref:1,2-phenylacetyl-CoA epoxidase subunit PaaC n=1 Tax=Paraflavitalea devenefica TaxID=2716334 RepID=UPI00141DB1E6|nr:1,2-phenylacetyl-CoA epoxidase subunit PaaC [Paraflavitalea devenefica]NII24299.1 phenylacetate-CoA oxygenase subunit PaaC [Paraflavitalea devenefica]